MISIKCFLCNVRFVFLVYDVWGFLFHYLYSVGVVYLWGFVWLPIFFISSFISVFGFSSVILCLLLHLELFSSFYSTVCFHDFSKGFNHFLLRFKYIALLWSILLRLLGPCRDNRSYWWLGLCAGLWDRMIMFLCVDICYCLCSVSVPFLHFWLNSLDISKVWVLFIGRESFYESICGRKE